MASLTYFLSLTLGCIICGCDTSFVKLKCNSHNHGRFGHQSLLECIVTPSKEAKDAKILRVIWMKEGAESALIDTTKLPFEPRFTLAEPQWQKHRNISMLVMNTEIADIGNYWCKVETDFDEDDITISLNVSAPNGIITTATTVTAIIDGSPQSQIGLGPNLASKVAPPVFGLFCVLGIIGLVVFLIRYKKRTHAAIHTDDQDLENGTHAAIHTDDQDLENGEPTED